MKAAHPEAMPIAGGTDVMVEINLDRHRPAGDHRPDARRASSTEWGTDDGLLRVGAGVTYTRIIDELGDRLPGLAMASRTVGSPQIRNRGTVGGNLGTASPAGDAHPPLLASDALVELASTAGHAPGAGPRVLLGPKAQRDAQGRADRRLPDRARRRDRSSSRKVGTRNAMVIAVCSFALALDPERRHVGTGIGSAAPTPVIARRGGALHRGRAGRGRPWEKPAPVRRPPLARFGELVAAAAKPIDDVRGTAAYRRHALAVMARRSFGWAWDDYRARASA